MKLRIRPLFPLLTLALLWTSVSESALAEGRYTLRAVVGAPAPAQILITPDGLRAITAGQDDLVRVWDLDTLQVLRSFGHRGAAVQRVALFEGLLLAGDADGVTRAYTVHDGKEQYSMPGNGRPVIAVDASPGLVAVGALHGPLQTFDADTGRPIGRADGPGEWFARATFDLPRGRAASTGEEGHVRLWNLNTGALLHTLKVGGVQTTQLAFSPDGRWIAGGDWDGHVRVWDTETGALAHTLQGSGRTGGISFSPDGSALFLRGPDDAPIAYLLSDGSRREFPSTPRWTGLPIADAQIQREEDLLHARADAAAHGETLVTAWGGTLRVWSTTEGRQQAWTDTGLAPVDEVEVSLEGRWVAAANGLGQVKVYASHNGALTAQMVLPEGPARAVAWDRGGEQLAIAGPDRLVRVWRPLVATPAVVLFGHDADVVELAWSPDGSLWSTDARGGMTRWHVDGKQARSARWLGCSVQGVDRSAQGHELVWCADGQAKTWKGEASTDLDFEAARLGAWGPKGEELLLSDGAGLSLLNDGGRLLFRAQSAVRPTALEWVGDQVAVGSVGGSVTLLDTDLEQIQTLRGQSEAVGAISMSRDGSVLAAGSEDGTLRIWLR